MCVAGLLPDLQIPIVSRNSRPMNPNRSQGRYPAPPLHSVGPAQILSAGQFDWMPPEERRDVAAHDRLLSTTQSKRGDDVVVGVTRMW
jgi:hypothetical protein